MSRALAGVALATWSLSSVGQVRDTTRVDAREWDRLTGRLPEECEHLAPLPMTDGARSIEIRTTGAFDSNTLYNDLILGLRRGEFIDRDVRERSQAALKENNRYGQQLEVAITYAGDDSLFGHTRWQPRISIAHHDLLGTRFTPDVYDLIFFGNATYEGRTADLSGSAHEEQRYQTLGFGIQDVCTGSFLQLDLVNGQYLNASDIDPARLYTGMDGRVIKAEVDGSYWQSDTAGSGMSNGWGLALAGRWSLPTRFAGHRSFFSASVQDLGFIHWRDALTLKKDSTIAYEGIEVENIFDLPDLIFSEDEIARYPRSACRAGIDHTHDAGQGHHCLAHGVEREMDDGAILGSTQAARLCSPRPVGGHPELRS